MRDLNSSSKKIKQAIANLQKLIGKGGVCDIVPLLEEFDELHGLVKSQMQKCTVHKLHNADLAPGHNIGTAEHPVALGPQFEGYKTERWSYRNSDPDAPRYARNYRLESDPEVNKRFDAFYEKSIRG